MKNGGIIKHLAARLFGNGGKAADMVGRGFVADIKVIGGKKYEAVLQKLADLKMGVKGGVLKNATTKDGKHIADYAAANEYGCKIGVTDKMRGFLGANYGIHLKNSTQVITIPPRPFLRTTAKEKGEYWAQVLAGRVKNKTTDRGAWQNGLGLVGEAMQANIKETIQKGSFAPNAALTVAIKTAKGKKEPNHPLVDTGQLFQGISYEVVK